MRTLAYSLLGLGLLATAPTASASVIYNDEATFLAALGPSRTFDFEASSGFPPHSSDIGVVDGIDFDAQIFEDSGPPVNRLMTGAGGTFTPATITFNAPTTGFGFLGFDLTFGEIIRVAVDYETIADEVFDVTLDGAPSFTPIYFGLIEGSDNILAVTIRGTDTDGNNRAWALDDFSTNAVASVPAPATLVLGLLGLAGMTLARSRRGAKA